MRQAKASNPSPSKLKKASPSSTARKACSRFSASRFATPTSPPTPPTSPPLSRSTRSAAAARRLSTRASCTRAPTPGASMTARNLAHLQRREARSANPIATPSKIRACKTPTACVARRKFTAPSVSSLAQAREMAAVELNSATDNPLVFARAGSGKSGGEKHAAAGDIISGGNFHGQPARHGRTTKSPSPSPHSAASPERRIEQMTNPLTSMLPAFLTPRAPASTPAS